MSPFELIRSPREYVYRSEITPHKKKKNKYQRTKTNLKNQLFNDKIENIYKDLKNTKVNLCQLSKSVILVIKLRLNS
jgi:hypothetical protein